MLTCCQSDGFSLTTDKPKQKFPFWPRDFGDLSIMTTASSDSDPISNNFREKTSGSYLPIRSEILFLQRQFPHSFAFNIPKHCNLKTKRFGCVYFSILIYRLLQFGPVTIFVLGSCPVFQGLLSRPIDDTHLVKFEWHSKFANDLWKANNDKCLRECMSNLNFT